MLKESLKYSTVGIDHGEGPDDLRDAVPNRFSCIAKLEVIVHVSPYWSPGMLGMRTLKTIVGTKQVASLSVS